MAGAGVGEVGGAHWFAAQQPEEAAAAAEAAEEAVAGGGGANSHMGLAEVLAVHTTGAEGEPRHGCMACGARGSRHGGMARQHVLGGMLVRQHEVQRMYPCASCAAAYSDLACGLLAYDLPTGSQGPRHRPASGHLSTYLIGVASTTTDTFPAALPGPAAGEVAVQVTYTISCDHSVSTSWTIDTSRALPARLAHGLHASLPRVGLATALPAALQQVHWYGCGPHESYCDRKYSAAVRQYSSTVQHMHVPYVFPQESGGRADVRWVALLPAQQQNGPAATGAGVGTGLVLCTAAGGTPVQLNVSQYSMKEYYRAAHDYELKADGVVHVHMDAAHMGVGGDDSWSPSVHEQYLIPPGVHRLKLVLAPCSSAQQAARQWRAGARS